MKLRVFNLYEIVELTGAKYLPGIADEIIEHFDDLGGIFTGKIFFRNPKAVKKADGYFIETIREDFVIALLENINLINQEIRGRDVYFDISSDDEIVFLFGKDISGMKVPDFISRKEVF